MLIKIRVFWVSRCVDWLTVTNVLKEHGAFIFTVKQCSGLTLRALHAYKTLSQHSVTSQTVPSASNTCCINEVKATTLCVL